MNYFKSTFSVIFCFAVLLPASSIFAAIDDRPNVILIYADDLGIGMLGCYGQKVVTTPNIDRLAAEGMRFTNYYGGTFCAPSRYSLATCMMDALTGGLTAGPA